MIVFTIPLKTTNPLNGAQGRTRGAVFAKAARRKKERADSNAATCAAWYEQVPEALGFIAKGVTMTRLSAGALDGDGLQAALKSVRDGIADAIGVDDGSDAVAWKYEQKKCKRGEFGVEVTIS